MLECFKMSWRFLSLSSFLWILVSSFFSGWMFLSSFWSTPLIWVPVSFASLLIPCTFSFVSLSIGFIFSSSFRTNSTNSVSVLITSVLNCASDRLAISSLLSCIFLELWCVFSFGPYFFVLGIHQGGATHVAALWHCMWGRGSGGNNATCSTLCRFSVTSPTTHKQIGPFWCWFLGRWACVGSRTLWVSPTNSPVKLGVFPAASSTPIGVFSQRLWGFISPHWNSGLHGLSGSPVVPPGLSAHECGTTQFAIFCLTGSSSRRLAVSLLYSAACLCPSYQSGWMFLL